MTAAPSRSLEAAPLPAPDRWRWLRNPFAIAILLSVGAHAVFFTLFPYLSDPAPAKPKREPVQTRALTVAEFARLPESLRGAAASPSIPSRPVAPFSGLPDLSALMSPMVLPPPPSPLVLPELNLPTPTEPPTQLPPPPVADETPPPAPPVSNTPAPTPAESTPQSAPADTPAVDEKLYAFNPEGTDASLGFGKLGEFVAALQTNYPDLKIPNQAIAIKLPLPESDRCFEQVKPAQFAVLVGANGKALEPPQTLVSSGYAILNQQAIAALEKQPYPLTGRTELKLVNLEFVPPESSSCSVPPPAAG
ncbi:unknown protein [Synechococcus elongatus PCC 6301]|uniref:TonB C-terminal domain-containing protein n=1 Tax=Synechococcus sp. (strain ATCC 27144 / PCC 6301 / SAUG 1402/1) TaxID=269084 RepID=A0A0H3K3P9_SYNP6|nr:hypothetical protein [Synechococcus elongatus]BAD79955.1 unknown protein [Synechococcus elongatus PCC 6301]